MVQNYEFAFNILNKTLVTVERTVMVDGHDMELVFIMLNRTFVPFRQQSSNSHKSCQPLLNANIGEEIT